MRHKRTACIAAALSLLGLVLPAPGAAESLPDVLVEAVRNSPELEAQRANVKIAAERAVQAAAGGRPTITGDIGLELEVNDTDDTVFPSTLRLSAEQPLYTGGQVENATEAAEKRIEAEKARLSATEQQVLRDAVTAFSDVRRDQVRVRISVNNVRVLSEQLRAARERFEVGEVTRTDVEQARARLAAARSILAAQRGGLEISKEAFARVVGRPPDDLDPPPPLPDLPEALEQAVQIALRKDPTLLAARIERDASGSDVRAAIGALLPQISLRGELSQIDTANDNFEGRQSASIGIAVTIPFYTGGANYSAVRQEQAEVEFAESEITSAIRNAIERTGTAWSRLEVARATINAGRLEVRAAELAFEGVNEEAKVGARTTLDVLDAEQEVLDARLDLATAKRDEYVAAYDLLEAMGVLTVEHLGLDIGERPPASRYYESVRDRNFGYDQTDDTVWSLTWRP